MIQKCKEHFKKHKELYIGIGIGLGVVTLAGITVLIMRESRTPLDAGGDWSEKAPTDSLIFSSGKTVFGDVNNNIVNTFHKGTTGNPGFITRCIETGEVFATQGDAARAFDIPESILSKHLNYGRQLVENLHFERVGVFSS